MQRTLVLVKPDGVKKGVIGQIISRFETKGLQISALKMLKMTDEQAAQHYAEHLEKPFFPELAAFITSGPLVAMVVTGPNAVPAVRTMMGATNPLNAAPGTIRSDFALTMSENIVHGSDSPESAEREINIFFIPCEVYTKEE